MKNHLIPNCVLRAVLVGLLPGARSMTATADTADSDPPKGTVIVIGGGSERGAGIVERFINRAGGPDANFVIVPTGNGSRNADGQPKAYSEEEVLAVWRTRGLKHVRMLHTEDPGVANTDAFVQPLREAHAIWFDGDNQQDLLASYANTLAEREFAQVLQRGGVIAGNAAGATTLGAHLLRPDLSASAPSSGLELGRPGFGFLPNVVFDLQVNTRERWDNLGQIVQSHPEILGLGLSETTAIVMTGDRFEVVGKWAVAVHDGTLVSRPNEKPFRLLFPGDVFNVKTRRVERFGNGTQTPPPLVPASTPAPAVAAPAVAPPPSLHYGPAKGTLMIVGGGSMRGTGIMETFVNRAGGLAAKIVVIPTGNGNRTTDGQLVTYKENEVLAPWKRQLRLRNVHMLHTADPAEANSEAFVQVLRDATGVWFDGGRQWNFVDSYQGTLALQEIRGVLERGGVIGGTSAGATIQGEYLVRGAVAGPEIIMPPEPEHQHGFAFLRHSAIDQHINTRNRWDDLVQLIKRYPEYLGIGLSEGTAIIVNGDRFEVIGKWKVTVHDSTAACPPWEKPYLVLSAGDRYNMLTRRTEKVGDRPLEIPLLMGGRP